MFYKNSKRKIKIMINLHVKVGPERPVVGRGDFLFKLLCPTQKHAHHLSEETFCHPLSPLVTPCQMSPLVTPQPI